MGIERYVEKMCLANAHLKENNLISKWKLAQPNREKSPELERLLRQRFQEGHHRNAFTPRARQHAGGRKGGSDLSRNGSAHHPDMRRARSSSLAPTVREMNQRFAASQRRRAGLPQGRRPRPDPTPGEQLAKLGGAVGVVGGVGALGRSIYHSETTCPNCGERARPCASAFVRLRSLAHGQRCPPGASGWDGYHRFKTTTLERATTQETGLREVHDMCNTCGYEDIYTETIARIQEDDDEDSSSSSSWSSSSSSSYSDNSSSSWSSSSSDSSWSDSSSGYSGGSSSGSGSSSTW